MRWPFVSRLVYDQQERYITFLSSVIDKLQKERDEQQERGDRAMDMLVMSQGYEPASPKFRAELSEAKAQQQAQDLNYAEMLKTVDADIQAERILEEEAN